MLIYRETDMTVHDSHFFGFYNSSNEGTPAVIILDQLNCLASLADIFDFSQLEKNSSWYVMATFSVETPVLQWSTIWG